jgi:hypothetical protein
MPETAEQAQMRQHLAEMRRAAHGLGHDIAIKIENLDQEIDRFGKLTAKEAKYTILDIHDDFAALSRAIDQEARKLPHQVGSAIGQAGAAVGGAMTHAASATEAAFDTARSKTVEGTKNAAARVAGVRRTPMKEWHTPANDSDSP